MQRRTMIQALSISLLLPQLSFAQSSILKIRALYNKDLSLSDVAQSLDGERIHVSGYMAPPLKADTHFFVLTKMPMATCPFCEPDAEWPDDILAVYTKRPLKLFPFNVPIIVRGRLKLGHFEDPEVGFPGEIRLIDAAVSRQG